MLVSTFPDPVQMHYIELNTPDFMHPNNHPIAVIGEEVLTPDECSLITNIMMRQVPYKFDHCDAQTREAPTPLHPCFDKAVNFAELMNTLYWNHKIDPDPYAWMQTYIVEDKYDRHTDGSLGQSRKLTAVLMLTDANEYEGGTLLIHTDGPRNFAPPKKQGTIVVFPPWVQHSVTSLLRGCRQTINLGWFGPPFK